MRNTFKKIVISIFMIVMLSGCAPTHTNENTYINNREITIGACDLSGKREKNVKVDIGYGDRKYYGYTNGNGQLVFVEAKVLKLQYTNELKRGEKRYCTDEAFVKGVESREYDQGHVIADSLGGVSNAYNITPQFFTVNREGKQQEMEALLNDSMYRNAKVTEFTATIEYSNTQTQIPSHYRIEFQINGVKKVYDFKNGV